MINDSKIDYSDNYTNVGRCMWNIRIFLWDVSENYFQINILLQIMYDFK